MLREEPQEYTLAGKFIPLKIPVTLKDSLMARLDRLGPAKELVQLCSILGREFTSEMLLAIQPQGEQTLRQGLRQLVESELLYQRGVLPKATFIFKHALIQETAYQSMLKNTRRRYHQKIAEVLVKQQKILLFFATPTGRAGKLSCGPVNFLMPGPILRKALI